MKCSLSQARLRACAARDSDPPLWVAGGHGGYWRARHRGTRGGAVESPAAVVLRQKDRSEQREGREADEWAAPGPGGGGGVLGVGKITGRNLMLLEQRG